MDEDERPTSKLGEKVKEAEETLAQAEDELNQASERAAASKPTDDPGSPETAVRPA